MATLLIQPQEPARRGVPPGHFALWDLGFRPFYLLAAAFAALSVPLWALQFSGLISHPWLRGPLWHAHEMVFGYTLAIVVGFLFTAGRNWSGQPTPTGRPLMALAALWVAARVLVLTPWGVAAALVNVAFPLLAAWGLWRALRAGNNKRNYFFVALLVMMATASAVVHLAELQWLTLPAGLGIPVALDGVLFMIAVMAGRVVPMFSNNGVPGMRARRDERLEKLALGSVLALLAADALQLHGAAMAALLGLALLAHAARLALWQPWKTLRNPLVWVLHAAYLWLLLHLALRAAAELGWIAPSLATHALTLGVIGTITLGMITRTALGHTGRPLRAGRIEIVAYLAMLGAALVRVGVPLVEPAWLLSAVTGSALLWSLAFVLYLVRYTPILLRARADGQPG
ncbi:NnrS family protein [Leptothrix cholodnii SP-6]|uniref:NnrS family protein n=1 Tax=Leptothrix cholodnii (strain ATCC 51168 / LMG 8142 / SP-6) TaxID=395495 RepID=B1Y801_LEPCP|nr:NnrS family protein [Leptothrix cholodnii]ACB33743.1 NnrS family protein [Leptothrix cholodnii SP-6]